MSEPFFTIGHSTRPLETFVARPEVNGFWENQSFHNYADYAMTPVAVPPPHHRRLPARFG